MIEEEDSITQLLYFKHKTIIFCQADLIFIYFILIKIRKNNFVILT